MKKRFYNVAGMNYGTFCSNRETFGISINKELLIANCSLVNQSSSSDLISLTLRVFTGISWFSMAFFGTVANVSVLFVIGFIKSMRTIPNWLLFNLAVADSLMTIVAFPLLGVFQTLYYPVWQLPFELCYVLNCFTHIGALASGASLAAISMHRFIMIRFPRRFEITKRHLVLTICTIWVVAIGGSVSSMSSAGVIGMIRPVAGEMHLTRLCIQVNPTSEREKFQLAFRCVMYLIYALFLLLLYTNIGYIIYKSKSPGHNITASASMTRKKQAVRLLVAATIVMIFSYLPYMVLVSKLLFAKAGYYSPVFAVEILCNIVSALNHVVNPFIYCALSQQFREGFRQSFAYLRMKSQRIAPENMARQQPRISAPKSNFGLQERGVLNGDNKPENGRVLERLAACSREISFQLILNASPETPVRKLVRSTLIDSDEKLNSEF